MLLPKIINTEELFIEIDKTNLYQKIINQLNKDFELIGIDFSFDQNQDPKEFYIHLLDVVETIIQNKSDDFLNLLYRIDIDEIQIRNLIKNNSNKLINQISFLILKREWQKVWFKEFYQK
jgi:hypothetical protein